MLPKRHSETNGDSSRPAGSPSTTQKPALQTPIPDGTTQGPPRPAARILSRATAQATLAPLSRPLPGNVLSGVPMGKASGEQMPGGTRRAVQIGVIATARVKSAAEAQAVKNGGKSRKRAESRTQLLNRLLNPVISLREASILLEVCPATMRHYSDEGWLPHVRTTGGQRRFYLRDVLALMEKLEEKKKR